jgi:hypothetical protein
MPATVCPSGGGVSRVVLVPSSAQNVVWKVPLTVREAGTQAPATQTTPLPHGVRSSTSPTGAQVLSVAVALHEVAKVLHGSAAPAGVQACPAVQAAMQAPLLHTWPEPQAVPSDTFEEVSEQITTSPWQACTPVWHEFAGVHAPPGVHTATGGGFPPPDPHEAISTVAAQSRIRHMLAAQSFFMFGGPSFEGAHIVRLAKPKSIRTLQGHSSLREDASAVMPHLLSTLK